MGTTPLSLQLKADRTYNVEFRKKGYQPITRVVGSKVGAGWVILDIMSGFVPIVIDAATGAWNVLDESEIDANLEQGQSEK